VRRRRGGIGGAADVGIVAGIGKPTISFIKTESALSFLNRRIEPALTTRANEQKHGEERAETICASLETGPDFFI
jgi:hypothetical protein